MMCDPFHTVNIIEQRSIVEGDFFEIIADVNLLFMAFFIYDNESLGVNEFESVNDFARTFSLFIWHQVLWNGEEDLVCVGILDFELE